MWMRWEFPLYFSKCNKGSRTQGWELFVDTSLTSAYSLCRCFLVISLWRAADSLGNSQGCLWIPIRPRWPNTQLDITQFWYWQLHLMIRWLVGNQLHYLVISFRSPLYMYVCILWAPVLDFHTAPQMALKNCLFL